MNQILKPNILWVLHQIINRYKNLIAFYVFLRAITFFDWINFQTFSWIWILVVIILLYTFLEWINIRYLVNNEQTIIIEKGIYNRRKIVIDLNSVNSIEIERSILQKLSRLKTIKIHLDTNSENKGVALEYLNENEQLQTIINRFAEKHVVTETKVKSEVYGIKQRDVIMNSFVSLKVLMIIPFYFTVVSFVERYFRVNDVATKYMNIVDQSSYPLKMLIILGLLLIMVIYGIFANWNYLKGFKLEIKEDNVLVQYGFLKQKESLINKSKISSLLLTQNLVERVCGIYQLKCISQNQDTSEEDEKLLFPIWREKDITSQSIAQQIGLHKFLFTKLYSIPRRGWVCRFLRMSILIVVSYFVGTYFNIHNYLLFLLITLILINSCLKAISDKIFFQEHCASIIAGGIFKKMYGIPKNKIEFCMITQSPLQQTLQVATIKVMIRKNPYKRLKVADVDYEVAIKFKNWLMAGE